MSASKILFLLSLLLVWPVEAQECRDGMIREELGHCCWPGQHWLGVCLGEPLCPAGFQRLKGSCWAIFPSGMVLVPAGEFIMGSNEEKGEKPIHQVYLDAFAIDKTEVTTSAYKACVDSGYCSAPDRGWYCNWDKSDRGDHPINCVDWHQSVSFCQWKGKRLPTEAEWEKAAKGTSGQKYPWGGGSASCSKAVMDDGGLGCGRNSTWPVGLKPSGASPYGAQDMAGNVWEWTSDWYVSDYYSSSPSRNPAALSGGPGQVVRGGSWLGDGLLLRASCRGSYVPSYRLDSLGFRCVSSF